MSNKIWHNNSLTPEFFNTKIDDVRASLYVRREDRQIDEGEANRFGKSARELMERLQKLLDISDGEMA